MKTVFLVLITFLFPFISHGKLQVQVVYSPVANFIYQLDCVSGVDIHCSNLNYEKLWNDRFLKSEEDREQIKKWATLRGRFRKKSLTL
jgi:hypothetical protein